MPRLTITEFNTPEFYGIGGNMPGGYGWYQTTARYIVNPTYGGYVSENFVWYPRVQRIIEHGSLVGKTVIELGCAFGHLTKLLVDIGGADAYGLDLSYPISQAQVIYPEIASRFIAADARIWLPTQKKNSWDVIISRGFLDCLTDAELATLIPIMNNVSKFQQIHSVDPTNDPEYYNQKPLAEWQALPWEAGTIILDDAS